MTLWPMNSFRSAKRLIIKFLGLSSQEKKLLVEALVLLYAVRLGLWALPFRALNDATSGCMKSKMHGNLAEGQIIRAVKASSKFVPRATCLTQAMAARKMLLNHGYNANLRIGVLREDDDLKAHAWLEKDGQVLIGGLVCEYQALKMDGL